MMFRTDSEFKSLKLAMNCVGFFHIFPTSGDIFQSPWQVIDETAAAFFGGGARWTIRLRRVCVVEGGVK